jgi:hypothetical protein
MNHRPSPAGSDGQTDSLKSIPRTVALSLVHLLCAWVGPAERRPSRLRARLRG